MAQTTKKALAESLKSLLMTKSLDKITISDIVDGCDVNRQTFYYHFKDIYDLIEWLFLTEAAEALDGKKTYDTWQQGFLQIFDYVAANKTLVTKVYYSMSRDQLERYLYALTYDLLIGVVNEQSIGLSVRESDRDLIANFYKFAFVGLMLDWIRNQMRDDPEAIIQHISILINGDIRRALEKFQHF
jgi:probable dihydroxyacetone kinase regulator